MMVTFINTSVKHRLFFSGYIDKLWNKRNNSILCLCEAVIRFDGFGATRLILLKQNACLAWFKCYNEVWGWMLVLTWGVISPGTPVPQTRHMRENLNCHQLWVCEEIVWMLCSDLSRVYSCLIPLRITWKSFSSINNLADRQNIFHLLSVLPFSKSISIRRTDNKLN